MQLCVAVATGLVAATIDARAQALPPIVGACEVGNRFTDVSPIVDTIPSIFTKLLSEDAQRTCYISGQMKGVTRSNVFATIQVGSLRGIAFKVYESDGSGSVQGVPEGLSTTFADRGKRWALRCEVDPMDDSVTCLLRRGDFTVFRDTAGFSIFVGTSAVPASSVSIRIDEQPAFSASEKTGFRGASALAILGQMKSGKSARTRYQKWPSPVNVDGEFSLFGAAEALDLLDRAFGAIRKRSRSK